MVAIYDPDLKIQFINGVALRLIGRPLSDLIGKLDEEIWPQEVYQTYLPILQKALDTGKIQFLETDLLLTKIGIRNLKITCVPLFNEKGNVLEVMNITQDLTEQKQREKEYKDLIDGMNDAVFVIGFDGKFVEVNKTAVEVLGYSRKELFSLGPEDIDPYLTNEDIKRLFEVMKMDNQQVLETRHRTKNGSVIPVEISSSRLTYRGSPVVLSIVRDITERKHAESERDRLIAAIEHAGEIIFITDPDGTIQYVNPAFERITGYTKQEVIGKTPRILKSGQQDEAFYRQMWKTISGGDTWQGRMINKRKDGTFYTEKSTISSVKNHSGKIINYVTVAHDITEYLRLMAQFQQAQKMESIGRLAGGVAHDYNNMLGVIMGFTELAMDKVNTDGKGTTFKIYLSRHSDAAMDTTIKSAPEVPISHGESVLVVENEVSILKLTLKILDGLGYSVLTANTPNEAIRLAREHTGEIHLLITDVVMPDINGWDLAGKLLTLYPKLKCLFMSGYTANVIAHRGILDEGVHFIQKPFSKKELAVKIREVLE